MEFVILDLEWNGTYSKRKNGFFNEIIEFGAVKVNECLCVVDTFSELVKPQIGKKLSSKVKSLTNISSEELGLGIPYTKAVSKFKRFLGGAVLMTWGTSDILALMENHKYYLGTDRLDYITAYINLQSFCEQRVYYEKGKQMGLSTAAQLLGIDEQGVEHHRALDDSLLALACFRRLYDAEELKRFFEDASKDEFYDKMRFKTTILCDLTNPLLKNVDMSFSCQQCGAKARRIEDWEFKNKSYRANFQCPRCGEEFKGRIQFKLKYEGVMVKKTIVPPKEEEQNEEAVSADEV